MKRKLRVLFACPFVPWPLTSGGKIRTYHLLRELGTRAEIDLFLVREETAADDARAALGSLVRRVEIFERGAPGPLLRWSRPKIERWFHSPDLVDSLRRSIAEREGGGTYDVVHLDELLLARTLPPGGRVPVVQHHHKIDSVLYDALSTHQGATRHFDLWKLRRLERDAARRVRHHVVCSAEDRALLLRRYPDLDVAVVPSGFDPGYFAPRADAMGREPDSLVFVGSMSYGPNVDGVTWFVREVLPRIRSERPGVRLDVVGLDPVAEVRALEGPGVRIVGGVPDVRPWFERAGAVVVPLRIGGGTRLKIVEALALASPVVSTRTGAEGLGLADGRELALAEDPAAFAAATLALLTDPEAAAALGRRGRLAVERRFAWSQLAGGVLEHWRAAAGA